MAEYLGAARAGIDVAGGLIIQGSPNVFSNGAPNARIGDAVDPHGPIPHRPSPVMAEGSPDVFINGIPASRLYDMATCGHDTTGSPNVFINVFGYSPLSTENSDPLNTEDEDFIIRESIRP